MENTNGIALVCVAIVVAIYAVRWYTNPLHAIPTVGGSSLPGLFHLTALRALHNSKEILEEGYRKYPESSFKIAMLDRWLVVVSGRNMVEELRKRPDGELSLRLGIREEVQTMYLLYPQVVSDEFHTDIVKEKITRMIPDVLPDILDELAVAVQAYIPTKENEWTSVEVMPAVQNIVAQASRNEEYLALAVNFAADLMKGAATLHLFPVFIRPIVALFIKKAKHTTDRAVPYLRPIVEERMKALAELGEGWNDKPNDVLQYILDRAIPKGEGLFVIAQRLLCINLAAIHTSSNNITHVLYRLAEKPNLLEPLREEIQASISADGWTPTALGNMWKLDSILRETLRYHGIELVSMVRQAKKDTTLGDGTLIPKGTLVRAAAYPLHHDGAYLENADTFDPFRYARMRSVKGESLKHQFTSTSPEYIPFGHGQHACPGRYFAANELKAILAHIILNYDLKLGGDGLRPPNAYFSLHVVPAPHGHVLFKKRETSA